MGELGSGKSQKPNEIDRELMLTLVFVAFAFGFVFAHSRGSIGETTAGPHEGGIQVHPRQKRT
jgi:hypothetical protein